MSYSTKFFIFFFVVGFLVGGIFISCSYFREKQSLLDETYKTILEEAETISNKIDNYLLSIEGDVNELRDSEDIRKILSGGLYSSEYATALDVNYNAKIIAKQIDNYMNALPDMNLEYFENNPEFQEIVSRDVGNGEHGFLINYEEQTIVVDKFNESSFENHQAQVRKFLEIYGSRFYAGEDSDISGFYNWINEDGKTERRYAHIISIDTKIEDNISLAIFLKASVDNYKVFGNFSEEADKYMKDFKNNSGYDNLILVSPDGYIGYEAEKRIGFGVNLEWNSIIESDTSFSYFNVKDNMEPYFYGPYIIGYGEIYSKFSAIVPVFNDEELLGYVVVVKKMGDIFDIINDISEFEETGEMYLIDRNRILISPLKSTKFDVMTQSIDTENSRRCFSEAGTTRHVGHPPIDSLLNYKGDEVVGAHVVILKPLWCLLFEVDSHKAIDAVLRERAKSKIFIFLIVVLSLSLFGLLVGKYLDYKKIRLTGMNNFKILSRRFNLAHAISLSIFFAIVYFFLITSLFQGWSNSKFFDDVPDLFIFVIASLFIYLSTKKCFDGMCHFVLLGGLFICVEKLLEIPVQEYQRIMGHSLSWMIWTPISSLFFIGVLFLLIGFRRLNKK